MSLEFRRGKRGKVRAFLTANGIRRMVSPVAGFLSNEACKDDLRELSRVLTDLLPHDATSPGKHEVVDTREKFHWDDIGTAIAVGFLVALILFGIFLA